MNPDNRPPAILTALFESLVTYGLSSDESMIDGLRRQYLTAVGETTDEERSGLMIALISHVEQRRLHANTLNPFLVVEPSPRLVSMAALHLVACYPDTTTQDPLHGVREITSLAQDALTRGEELRAAGMLLGMLQIGDRRINDQLGECWRWFGPAGRSLLAKVGSEFPKAATIDWLLNWLEQCEGNEFGAVAGTVARHGQRAAAIGVTEIRRALPIWDVPDDRVIQVLQSWSQAEFASRIAEQLAQLARHEEGDRIMPDVLQCWGLGMPEGVTAHTTTIDAATELHKLLEAELDALERSVGSRGPIEFIDPVQVPFVDWLVSREASPLAIWGALRDNVPSLSIVGHARAVEGRDCYLWFGRITPQNQSFTVFGVCRTLATDGGASCRSLLNEGVATGRLAVPDASNISFVLSRGNSIEWAHAVTALVGPAADRPIEAQLSGLLKLMLEWQRIEQVERQTMFSVEHLTRVCALLNVSEVHRFYQLMQREDS